MQQFRDPDLRALASIVAPFVALLLVGLAGRLWYPQSWPWPDFVHVLSDAFAVAGLLAIVFELSSANRLIKHTADYLAGRLVGHHLPDGLQETVGDIVIKTDLVMHDYVKAYRFRERSDGYLDVDVTITFKVVNYSNRSQGYAPHLSEEAIYSPRFERLEYGIPNGPQHAFSSEELKALVQAESEGRTRVVDGPKKVRIKPARFNKSNPDKCLVTWRYVVRMAKEYSDVTAFGRAAMGATVRLDGKPDDMNFFAKGPGLERTTNASSTWRSEPRWTPETDN